MCTNKNLHHQYELHTRKKRENLSLKSVKCLLTSLLCGFRTSFPLKFSNQMGKKVNAYSWAFSHVGGLKLVPLFTPLKFLSTSALLCATVSLTIWSCCPQQQRKSLDPTPHHHHPNRLLSKPLPSIPHLSDWFPVNHGCRRRFAATEKHSGPEHKFPP